MISQETRELIEELKKVEGECRGVSLQSPLEYVKLNYGEEIVNDVERELSEVGLPTRKDIKVLKMYPVGYMTIVHLIIKDVLSCDYSEIRKMGYSLPQLSFIVRTLSTYFISPERTFKETPNYWKKHFTVGSLVPVEIDIEKKYLILRIEGYKTHPIDCVLFEGYFSRMIGYTLKAKNISGEEKKCIHNGEECHEFLIKWSDEENN